MISARGGGTLTLGFTKTTNTIVSVVHFGHHDWTGGHVMADTDAIDAKATSRAHHHTATALRAESSCLC